MIRKIIFLLLSFLVINFSFAGAGFYTGVSIGPEGADFSQKAHIVIPGTINAFDRNHFAGIGGFGSVFAGIETIYDAYYLAAEINANISSLEYRLVNEERLHHSTSTTYFNIKNSEGISILPGYWFSPTTLFYARVGYINGRVKVVESDPTIKSMTKDRNGIRYGLGIRHAFSKHLDFIMDYSQINYQSLTSRVVVPVGLVTKNTSITPNSAQIGFGLIYHFDRFFIK